MKRDCQCPQARHEHGTEQAYITDRCRCPECKQAHAQRAAWRRKQHAYGREVQHLVPAIGSARRIEALACLGWSFTAQADRLGVDPVLLHRVRQQGNIISTKAAMIAALYDELWDRRAPRRTKGERISAQQTAALAARSGFVPPLAWDDDEIDDPAAQPHLPQGGSWDLKPHGTTAAARRHYRRGEPLCGACRAAGTRKEDAA